MWIESNSPELSVPYLWTEEKQSSEYFNPIYIGGAWEPMGFKEVAMHYRDPNYALDRICIKNTK